MSVGMGERWTGSLDNKEIREVFALTCRGLCEDFGGMGRLEFTVLGQNTGF